jgi:hypothetical protein
VRVGGSLNALSYAQQDSTLGPAFRGNLEVLHKGAKLPKKQFSPKPPGSGQKNVRGVIPNYCRTFELAHS